MLKISKRKDKYLEHTSIEKVKKKLNNMRRHKNHIKNVSWIENIKYSHKNDKPPMYEDIIK